MGIVRATLGKSRGLGRVAAGLQGCVCQCRALIQLDEPLNMQLDSSFDCHATPALAHPSTHPTRLSPACPAPADAALKMAGTAAYSLVTVAFISGWGKHSPTGAKILPAIQDLLCSTGIDWELENPGKICALIRPDTY